jgi:hypothetical protein
MLIEGILGVIFFNIYGANMGYMEAFAYFLVGGIVPCFGILLVVMSIIVPEGWILIRSGSTNYGFIFSKFLIFTAFLSTISGLLLNFLWLFYFSQLLLSWACAAFIWGLIIEKQILSDKFEPELEIVESTESQEEELSRELKTAGIDPIGHFQMIINRIAYLDPVYASKKSRWWLWSAKGRVVLTDRELIFLSVKKKKINFSIPISEIEKIQVLQAQQRSFSYKTCEIIYGNPKISAIFMTYFVTLDKFGVKLQETLQKWYETWHE